MKDPLDYEIFLGQGRIFPVVPVGYWIGIEAMTSNQAANCYLDLLVWSKQLVNGRARMRPRTLRNTVLAKALLKQIKEGEKP